MLVNKISKYTGLLNKLKHYLPIYTLRTLYFSMINSILNYGILVWGFSCQRLIKLQKKAKGSKFFKTLDILTLDDRFNLNALKFYYKYIRDTLPPYFYSFNIVTQGSIHEHMTRQRDLIRTERPRIIFAEKRLRVYLSKLINDTPVLLLEKIATHFIQGFSSSIKRFYLHAYESECSIPHCYVCRFR